MTNVDKIIENTENSEQLLFDISELTGSGNYKTVDLWSLGEILSYTDKKKKQIQRQNVPRGTKHD